MDYSMNNEQEWVLIEKKINQYYPNDSLKEAYHEIANQKESFDIYKTEYLYFPEEKTRIEILKYVKNNEWMMNQKKVYIFNEDGFLTAEESYSWSVNRWVDTWKIIYTFIDDDNLSRDNSYQYMSTGYGKSDSTKNHYKNGGFLDRKEFYRFDQSEWKKYQENFYIYNENELTEEIQMNYISNGNIDHSITKYYSYDDENRLTQEKITRIIDGVRTDSLKYVYNFEDDLVEKYILLGWDGSKWDYKKQSLYVYDENDQLSYEKEQYYGNNNIWLDYIFNYYSYDQDGRLKDIIQEFEDNPGFQRKREYVYNDDGYLIEIRHFSKYTDWSASITIFFEYNANNVLAKEIEKNKNGQINKQTDYYYDWINKINDSEEDIAIFQVFPNPFNNQLFIKFRLDVGKDVSAGLYDAEGKPVIITVNGFYSFGDSITLNTQLLSSGFYYVIIKIGDKSYSQKVTKVR